MDIHFGCYDCKMNFAKIQKSRKQRFNKRLKLCHAMLIWGDFSKTLPAHNPQRESLRLQNYKKNLICAKKICTFDADSLSF